MDALFVLLVGLIGFTANEEFLHWIVGIGVLGLCFGMTLGWLLAVRFSPRIVLAGFFAVALGLLLWSALSDAPEPVRSRRAILDDPTQTMSAKVAEIQHDYGTFGGLPGRVARHRSPAAAGVGLAVGSSLGIFVRLRLRRRKGAADTLPRTAAK